MVLSSKQKGSLNICEDQISCPLCQTTDKKVYLVAADMIIFSCSLCGMLYRDFRQMTGTQQVEFAADLIKDQRFLSLKSSLDKEERLKNIAKSLGRRLRGAKILEIGSGLGTLADLLLHEGAEYKGLEASRVVFESCISAYPHLKGYVVNCSIEDFRCGADIFDVVIMIDTFEHLANPMAGVQMVKKFLKKNGIIYIEVPNENFLKIKGVLRNWLNIYGGYPSHPAHVNFFTRQTLEKFLTVAGFRISDFFQISIFGNKRRMTLALHGKTPAWLNLACWIFYITKIDLMCQQGNLVCVARK